MESSLITSGALSFAAAEASFVRRRDWVKVPQQQRIFDFPDQAANVSPGVISAISSGVGAPQHEPLLIEH